MPWQRRGLLRYIHFSKIAQIRFMPFNVCIFTWKKKMSTHWIIINQGVAWLDDVTADWWSQLKLDDPYKGFILSLLWICLFIILIWSYYIMIHSFIQQIFLHHVISTHFSKPWIQQWTAQYFYLIYILYFNGGE